jgi:hypothetical protein
MPSAALALAPQVVSGAMRTATAADWRLTRVSIYVAVEGNLEMLWRGATRHLVQSASDGRTRACQDCLCSRDAWHR